MLDASSFNLETYAGIIDGFQQRDYDLVGYDAIALRQRHLVLRHDVDFSLQAAVDMGRFEAARGWQAYYFVLLRTEFYNPVSDSGLASLQELTSLGHKIGLHFDASLYQHVDDLPGEASRECDLLAKIIGQPVDVLSLHRPHPGLLGEGFEVANRLNAYSARFFRDIAYCSDSRGAWHHGHPLDHETVDQGGPMQLLTHPIWWTGVQGAPLERLEAFYTARLHTLDTEISANSDLWTTRDGTINAT
jgi:hypothetical protein